MIRPKNETGDFLLSITKECKTPFKQIHTKAQKHKKHLNLSSHSQNKPFILHHLLILVLIPTG